MLWTGYLCGGVVLVLLVGVLVLCLPYWRSPQRRWRNRVRALVAGAQRQAQAEERELDSLHLRREWEERTLHARTLDGLLGSIPVEELEAYPGIGPVTVGKLRGAGFATLADFQNTRRRVPGLGEKRLGDVSSAVNDLARQALSRFQAGASPQAHDLADRIQELATRYDEIQARAVARKRAAGEVLDKLRPAAEVARQISLLHYLKGDPAARATPPETELPDLHSAVHAADEAARADRRPPVRAVKAGSHPASPNGVARPAAEGLRLATLELVVQFAFATARTDGSISRKERAIIEEFLGQHFAGDPALQNRVRALCAHYESAAIDVETCLARLAEHVLTFDRRSLVSFAVRIAGASGPMNEREAKFLERVSRQWAVAWEGNGPPVEAPSPASPAPPPTAPPEDPRAVLEIEPSLPLSADLIRRQYHLLRERYTPERVEAMGPEFFTLAKRKHDAVTAAARALLESLGQPLEASPAAPPGLRENPDLDAVFGA